MIVQDRRGACRSAQRRRASVPARQASDLDDCTKGVSVYNRPPAREARLEHFELRVNGEPQELLVLAHRTLLEVLREDLGLTGTKHGCELGECGACTVLIDGMPQLSCLTLPAQVIGREVTTIEGVADGGTLHALQESFGALNAAQCGYCTPGMIVTAAALLDREPDPSLDQIRHALGGNMCRCTGYLKILEAVQLAAAQRVATP